LGVFAGNVSPKLPHAQREQQIRAPTPRIHIDAVPIAASLLRIREVGQRDLEASLASLDAPRFARRVGNRAVINGRAIPKQGESPKSTQGRRSGNNPIPGYTAMLVNRRSSTTGELSAGVVSSVRSPLLRIGLLSSQELNASQAASTYQSAMLGRGMKSV
jgi:hypothetical protein